MVHDIYLFMFSNDQKPFAPKRYYSIDRVFRNEAVDRTHLAEFHQIEGSFLFHCLYHKRSELFFHSTNVAFLMNIL